MLHNLVPISTRTDEVELVLSFMSSICSEGSGIYVSIPITSGLRYLKWLASNPQNREYSGDNQSDEYFEEVILKNVEHGKQVVSKLKLAYPNRIIINPTSVPPLDGWTQDDYRFAWGRVIERFGETAIFSDGWQFSLGCIYEFLVANKKKLNTLDESLNPLSIEDGRSLIHNAINELNALEVMTHFHTSIFYELEKLGRIATH